MEDLSEPLCSLYGIISTSNRQQFNHPESHYEIMLLIRSRSHICKSICTRIMRLKCCSTSFLSKYCFCGRGIFQEYEKLRTYIVLREIHDRPVYLLDLHKLHFYHLHANSKPGIDVARRLSSVPGAK